MVDLAARSRRFFIVTLNQPIQVLKQTELIGHQFTVYGTAENPLFLVKEVGEVLEYSENNSSKLTNLVDNEEKVRNSVTNPDLWYNNIHTRGPGKSFCITECFTLFVSY